MKKNKVLEQIRKSIDSDIKAEVNLRFEIADRIAEILAEQKISQAHFARKMRKSESEISKWLSGTHNFTIDTIAHIQEKLSIKIIDVNTTKISENFERILNKAPLNQVLSFCTTDEKVSIIQIPVSCKNIFSGKNFQAEA